MSSISIQQKAREQFAAEKAAAAAKLQKEQQDALTVTLQRDQREREARLRAAAERERAMIRAERLEAEAAARAEAEAEKAALDEEMKRLRNRTPLEILQEELEEMKQMVCSLTSATRVQRDTLHLRVDGELDMRFKASREELAATREDLVRALREIELLKQQSRPLSAMDRFVIRNIRGNVLDINGGGATGNLIAHAFHGGENQLWTFERI